ncbi:hypothetical protein FE257_002152 [Aspergillus nanangensis]|uniref:Uncharacterized protein n=1 Tax=Aspergillus nanangensis TaxID=2582783 RepID=A0AAD4GX66_ASPNN|nr:hypothetical protein FE257_002152 [Aspergillus nanangensis]
MGRPSYYHDLESHHEAPSRRQSWTFILTWSVIGYACVIAAFLSLCSSYPSLLDLGLLPGFIYESHPAPFRAFSKGSGYFKKPQGLKVAALVPFYSPERTAILDCYLQKNLINNRGYLDRVTFIPQTNDTGSLKWLEALVEQSSFYAISPPDQPLIVPTLHNDDIFVWIDGDVVFLEDHTIPTILKTKLDYPDSLIVSANVANQAALKSLHSHPGTALPYLPELLPSQLPSDQPLQANTAQDWRVSNLPHWEGPPDFEVDQGFLSPFKGHRWLLSDDEDADRTPIATSVYGDNGPGLDHWTVHAQQHYSFLHHLEFNDLHQYKFPMWNNPVESISRNFLCSRGRDLDTLRAVIQQSHTNDLPLKAVREIYSDDDRRIIIDGKGLAVHYTDLTGDGLDTTDILQRYRAYAEEMVCPKTL